MASLFLDSAPFGYNSSSKYNRDQEQDEGGDDIYIKCLFPFILTEKCKCNQVEDSIKFSQNYDSDEDWHQRRAKKKAKAAAAAGSDEEKRKTFSRRSLKRGVRAPSTPFFAECISFRKSKAKLMEH